MVLPTCGGDLVDLLPADLLYVATKMAQCSPGTTEGLRGQAEGAGVPTSGERHVEQLGGLSR